MIAATDLPSQHAEALTASSKRNGIEPAPPLVVWLSTNTAKSLSVRASGEYTHKLPTRLNTQRGPIDEEVSPMNDTVPSIIDLGIDQETSARLLPLLDSFAKWELLRFLHDNPNVEAAIEDLARYTGRDETELKPAASALHAAGLFRQGEGEYGYIYSLTSDEKLRGMIGDLVDSFIADRLVRLAVSSHILKAHRESARPQQVPN
jgi:hypothetical protein